MRLVGAKRLERQRIVRHAWERYIVDGVEPTGVAKEIARSWRRARETYRLDPLQKRIGRFLSPEDLQVRQEGDEGLRLARPILDDFAARLGLSSHVLGFFDADGWLLSVNGAEKTVERVAAIDFRLGASLAEDSAGTNGPGTALAERRPVEVFASEHFVEAWQLLTCAAAPVFAPRVELPVGLVDITGPWETQRRLGLVLAKAIARAIEERLRAAASVRDEVLRFAFRAARESGDALVGVDSSGALLAANDAAERRRIVQAGALSAPLRQAVAQALADPRASGEAEVRLELPGAAAMLVSPVVHEDAVIGAVVRVPLRCQQPRVSCTRRAGGAQYDFGGILGDSEAVRGAIELGRIAARNCFPVVLTGEPGTGKTLFAHAIHAQSDRREGRLVVVSCGAIPEQLIEAELFGSEAEAFAGARREGRPGRFEEASGGTLFLDEVSELSEPAQAALLRVLQEKHVVRQDGSEPRPVDVRVVAATNKPLADEVRARRFRRDSVLSAQHALHRDPAAARARRGPRAARGGSSLRGGSRSGSARALAGARGLECAVRASLAGQRARAQERAPEGGGDCPDVRDRSARSADR